MRDIKLYNVFFPIWLMMFFPQVLVLSLPINFAFDSLALLIAFRCVLKLRKKELSDAYKRTIWRVFGFGFLADLLGAVILFASLFNTDEWWTINITGPISTNPFTNVYAALLTIAAVLVAGGLIFVFDYFVGLRNARISEPERRISAIIVAVVTAPYVMLVPTTLLSGGSIR